MQIKLEQKKIIPKKKKKNTNLYFDQKTEDAIISYNKLDQKEAAGQRQRIYNTIIYPAFKKIAAVMVNKYKIQQRLQNAQQMTLDTVVKMTKYLDQLNLQKGKAFSFFTVIARNYVLSQLDKGIRFNQRHTSINIKNQNDQQINLLQNCSKSDWQKQQLQQYNKLLYSKIIQQMQEEILQMVDEGFRIKQEDKEIAHGVIRLMKDVQLLDNFNKKAIMIYLSEMTNADNERINRILSIIGQRYRKVKQYIVDNDTELAYFYDMERFK